MAIIHNCSKGWLSGRAFRKKGAWHSIHTYQLGLFGEQRVGKWLKKLPEQYHVFYDVQLHPGDGNTDYVVVCPHGIYTIEVKFRSDEHRRRWWRNKEVDQAREEARGLHSNLLNLGIAWQWVTPLLVRADVRIIPKSASAEIDMLGYGQLSTFFRTRSENEDCQLTKVEIAEIVQKLKRAAGCKGGNRDKYN